MKEILKRGATSNILRVFLPDSASTTGAGKTGLTSSSTGLIISTIADVEASATTYTSAASNVETITTLGTFAAPSSGKARFKEVDATNFPGLYEIQIADARFSVANTTALVVSVQCTGVAPTFAEIQLVAVDLYDSVRMGMTALPNATAALSGGLATLSADQSSNGTIPVDVVKISGDSAAADNLEAATDGTGYNVGNGQIQALSVTNAVTVGTINSNVIAASAIATDAAQEIANAVWSANITNDYAISPATSAAWANDTFGDRVIRSTGNNHAEVQITGSNHVAADVHEFQAGVITAVDFATGAIDANALAASAAGEIADAVWDEQLSGHLTAGSTGEALDDAGGGGGGGGSTTVRMGPFTVRAEGQASDLPLDINKSATHGIDCKLVDAQGTGVDLTGATLSTKVYSTSGALVATISGTATYEAGGDMTWTIPTSVTNTAGTYTATITRTTGASDTEVFGPLRIYVRDI